MLKEWKLPSKLGIPKHIFSYISEITEDTVCEWVARAVCMNGYSAITTTSLLAFPIFQFSRKRTNVFINLQISITDVANCLQTEPLSVHLLNLEPERWRPLRSKLTPMFTSGKLKDMFGLILECADHFEKYLDKLTAKDEPADFREVTAKYTTDVIGSCAFGIEMSSMSDEDSEFRRVGREIFATSLENVVRLKMRLYASKLYDWLGYIVPDRRLAPFFTKLVTDTMRYRKERDIYRPDFIHMLMQLKEHPEKVGDISEFLKYDLCYIWTGFLCISDEFE